MMPHHFKARMQCTYVLLQLAIYGIDGVFVPAESLQLNDTAGAIHNIRTW